MDINYYDEHQEEFEAVKLALKGEMERIWGSMLKESGDTSLCGTSVRGSPIQPTAGRQMQVRAAASPDD